VTPVRLVWRNELGGLTFRIGDGADCRFLKWSPRASGLDLGPEAARLTWAVPFTPVPEVLETGADGSGWWMVTAALPGESAVADRWKADPATAVVAIGEGLRALHDALPVDRCPFSWSVEDRLAKGLAPPPEESPPPIDRLVVCHGDPCSPNTLIGDDGRWSGHVDLRDLGVADRWADLAVATWSTEWNYGPGWERALLDAYGIGPDPERTHYYRLLWGPGPTVGRPGLEPGPEA
jgi:kanamycin kinase